VSPAVIMSAGMIESSGVTDFSGQATSRKLAVQIAHLISILCTVIAQTTPKMLHPV